jgi:hypothetical protein
MKLTPLLLLVALTLPFRSDAAQAQLLSWNNLGMHCMDSDYSVFSILPPYNTIEAQLIVGGIVITNGSSYTVTYQAVADPSGSFNSTELGKGNYREFYQLLYTPATLPPETGLAGWAMPGTNNTPQAMLFEPTNRPAPGVATPVNWFRAEGIPITPYDDAGLRNPYPLMRLIARNGSNLPIATNDVVLPVSDEMDCRACHGSGAQAATKPAAGWVWSPNPERDYRLNILRLHDERQFADHHDLYTAALAARGFNPQGLYRGVVVHAKPVLCASCHASEALGTGSYSNIPPLTASVHSRHATVMDPDLHLTLDSSLHRAACYRCHPGSATKCLRGAMGGAIANDGSMAMQCQGCHGNMSQVGSLNRVGWFMEPNCQSCHTGTATQNSGQIRYTSSFDTNGLERVPVNRLFATESNTPAAGISLYRFSKGHGGLQCSACHGSTHAEFPATHRNDNLRNERIQGHAGVMIECTACHTSMAANNTTAFAGPHGMHPIGANWISFHHDAIHGDVDRQKCAACHGADYRGSVLSKAQADRSFNVNLDAGSFTLNLFRGAQVGCYNCHNGPSTSSITTNAPPTATSVATNTFSGVPVALVLPVSGAGAVARLITQPARGSVGLSNNVATYFPDAGFVGTDAFTFAAWDGRKNSLIATASVAVAQGPFGLAARAFAPAEWPAEWPAPFTVVSTVTNLTAPTVIAWNFGDGSAPDTAANAKHAYAEPGVYLWSVVASVTDGLMQRVVTNTGSITIRPAVQLSTTALPGGVSFAWQPAQADTVIEETTNLGPLTLWSPSTNATTVLSDGRLLFAPTAEPAKFFRARVVQ